MECWSSTGAARSSRRTRWVTFPVPVWILISFIPFLQDVSDHGLGHSPASHCVLSKLGMKPPSAKGSAILSPGDSTSKDPQHHVGSKLINSANSVQEWQSSCESNKIKQTVLPRYSFRVSSLALLIAPRLAKVPPDLFAIDMMKCRLIELVCV